MSAEMLTPFCRDNTLRLRMRKRAEFPPCGEPGSLCARGSGTGVSFLRPAPGSSGRFLGFKSSLNKHRYSCQDFLLSTQSAPYSAGHEHFGYLHREQQLSVSIRPYPKDGR